MLIVCSYLTYWHNLSIARLANWGSSNFFIPPSTLGWFHAKVNAKQDIVKLYYNGLRPLWHADVELMLAKDYEIDYVNLNHLDHSEWHEAYEKAYNKVTRSVIRHKFGVDVIDLCLTKAEFRYRESLRHIAANQTLKIA